MLKEFLLSLAVATTPNPQQALEPVLPIIEPQTSGSDLIFSHTLTEETGVVPDEEKMQYDIYNAIEFFLNTESDESYFQDLHDKLYENPGNYFFFDFETVSDSQIAEMDCYYFKDGMTDPRYRFTEGYFSPDLYLTIRFSNEDNFFGSVEVGVQVNSQGELMGSSSSPQSYEIGEFPNEEIKELIEKYFLLPARVDGFLWEGYDGFTVGHASFSNSNVTVGGFNDGLLFIFAEMLPPTTEETPDFNGTNPPVGPIQT